MYSESQIRANVHQMLASLWPDNPQNLRHLPREERQSWFSQFVTEKRQHWRQKQTEFLKYGRQADADKEAIKLSQLELSLQQLAAESRP